MFPVGAALHPPFHVSETWEETAGVICISLSFPNNHGCWTHLNVLTSSSISFQLCPAHATLISEIAFNKVMHWLLIELLSPSLHNRVIAFTITTSSLPLASVIIFVPTFSPVTLAMLLLSCGYHSPSCLSWEFMLPRAPSMLLVVLALFSLPEWAQS